MHSMTATALSRRQKESTCSPLSESTVERMMQSSLRVPPLFWIMLLAVAGRAWLLFSTPYMPGVNGAYYLIQARAILERGVLGISDLPLIFYWQAGLASILFN